VLESLGSDFIERFRARYGDGSTHSLVRKHYVTGRPLVYLAGAFMDHVVEMDREEGRSLLRELMEIADHEVHQIRWKWEVDDLAIWDERSTMHRVDASHWPKQRLMRRCTIS
jgi:taurine dioxygenase